MERGYAVIRPITLIGRRSSTYSTLDRRFSVQRAVFDFHRPIAAAIFTFIRGSTTHTVPRAQRYASPEQRAASRLEFLRGPASMRERIGPPLRADGGG